MSRARRWNLIPLPMVCAALALGTPFFVAAQETPPVAADAEPKAHAVSEDNAKISFSFSDKAWEDVFEWLAELTGRSLLLEAKPEGSFTYIDSKKYTLSEAINIINGVLLSKGYVLLTPDNFLKVADVDDLPPHMVPSVAIEELPKRGDTEFLRVLMPLHGTLAENAKKEFEPLMGANGQIISLPSRNELLMVGPAKTLRLIVDLIKANEGDQTAGELKVFQLKHIRALEAERTVREMLQLEARDAPASSNGSSNRSSSSRRGSRGRGGDDDARRRMMEMAQRMRGGGDRSRGGPPSGGAPQGQTPAAPAASKATTSVNERTNTLFVTATADKLAIVSDVIKVLDVPQDDEDEGIPQIPRIQVYPVEVGTAEGLSEVMETIFHRSPETRVTAHPDGRALIVYATPAEHDKISAIVDQLKTEGLRIDVIPLRSLDASVTATLLKAVMGQKEDTTSSSPFSFFRRSSSSSSNQDNKMVSIEPDTERNRLVVRGTEEQISEVRSTLAKLGEAGVAYGDRGLDRGNLRVLRFGEKSPSDLARRIESAWKSISPDSNIKVEVLGRPGGASDGSPPNFEPRRETRSVEEEDDDVDPRVRSRRTSPQRPGRELQRRRPPRERSDEPAEDQETSLQPINFEEPIDEASEAPATETKETQAEETAAVPVEQPEQPQPLNLQPAAQAEQSAPEQAEPERPEGRSEPSDTVSVVIGEGDITLFSSNPELLDLLEMMVESIVGPPEREAAAGFAIYHLKSSDAEEMAYLIDEALYGVRSPFAGTDTSQARILPDTRQNALLVVGSPAQQRQVSALVEYLDTEAPETGVASQPRMIQLYYADAAEVAQVVKEVFAGQLLDQNQRNNQQRQNQSSFMSMFGMNNRNRQSESGKLTVGVEAQTNTLVVSAPRPLYEQVEELVLSLDDFAEENQVETRVVELRSANPEAVQKALKNLFGVQVGDQKAASSGQQSGASSSSDSSSDWRSRMRSGGFRSRSGGFDRSRSRSGGDRGSRGRSRSRR